MYSYVTNDVTERSISSGAAACCLCCSFSTEFSEFWCQCQQQSVATRGHAAGADDKTTVGATLAELSCCIDTSWCASFPCLTSTRILGAIGASNPFSGMLPSTVVANQLKYNYLTTVSYSDQLGPCGRLTAPSDDCASQQPSLTGPAVLRPDDSRNFCSVLIRANALRLCSELPLYASYSVLLLCC